MHPFVMGEILLGSLSDRKTFEQHLYELPRADVASHREVMFFLNTAKLYSRGIGWVDLHLVASAKLSGAALWTRDKRLAQVARELGVA